MERLENFYQKYAAQPEMLSELQSIVTEIVRRNEEKQEELSTLQSQVGELKAGLLVFQKKETETKRALWKTFLPYFSLHHNHPQAEIYESIKNDFYFATAKGELTEAELNHNLQTIQPYLKIGLFKTSTLSHAAWETVPRFFSKNREDVYSSLLK